MIRRRRLGSVVSLAFACISLGAVVPAASARAAGRGLAVELWTDRGNDAVYQPGDAMRVQLRASDDAYLLVYEIDAEGAVRMLYPYRGSNGFVEGRRTIEVPPEQANVDLVVQQPTGQCFIVALAAHEPLRDLPWYLRPYDAQAENVGYEGNDEDRNDEDGVTSEGRIVGDPYVAMERIRRRPWADPGTPMGSRPRTRRTTHERAIRATLGDRHRPAV
jgi:hypothetical protein